MMHARIRTSCAAGLVMLVAGLCAAPASATGELLLIRRPAEISKVQVIEITDQQMTYWREDAGDNHVDLADCVALIDDAVKVKYADRGMLVLADGQRFPGEAISGANPGQNVLVWSHRKFGRIEVPLALVRSVSFTSTDAPPPAELNDVVVLSNGDQIAGFVTSLGDPITMTSNNRTVTQPLERVVSMSMVSPKRPMTGTRLWLTDGTVVDVSQFRLGHDGLLRITLDGGITKETQQTLKMNELRAVLFDAKGATPLAKLEPTSIDGPRTRYVLPVPVAREPDAPIGLSPITFSGPLTVRYALPDSPVEFVGEAVLPPGSRAWGDLELVIMDDDREVFRVRLNRDRPTAALRAVLRGSELTIRIEEGANGPLQDTVVLEHALLLNGR